VSDPKTAGFAHTPPTPGRLLTPQVANPREVNFNEALQNLNLTQQEQNLYRHGLNNQWMGGAVRAPGEGLSTIYQTTVRGPQGYYNIPTVWQGQFLPVPVAMQMAALVGWDYWPVYGTEDEALARYMQMHAYMDRDPQLGGAPAATGTPPPMEGGQ
jgi:hypothetical protein